MYFSVIEVVPAPGSEAGQKYAGGFVACWINSDDREDARERSIALVASAGWIVRELIEEKEVFAESYQSDDPALEYFEQAVTDDEVCVFHTFPMS